MNPLDPRPVPLPPTGAAAGPEPAALLEVARLTGTEAVLCLSTGAAELALACSTQARRVVAAHPEAQPTTVLGVPDGLELVAAAPEALPFADGSFDRVISHLASPRSPDLEQMMAELARVLHPEGRLVLVDNYVPEDPVADRFLNALEQLRDPRHVRTYRLSELAGTLAGAGLSGYVAGQYEAAADLEAWAAEDGAPGENTAVLRAMLSGAPDLCRTLFRIETYPAVRFNYLRAVLVAELGP